MTDEGLLSHNLEENLEYASNIQVAETFLQSAEALIAAKGAYGKLLELLKQAENIEPDNPLILCRSAKILFRFGVLNSKDRFILLALNKLKLAEEKDNLLFDQSTEWLQLWGNILVQIGKHLKDFSFFALAIEKYKRANEAVIPPDPTLFWDWGEAWVLLGQMSGELSDFQQGLTKFVTARERGMHSHFFNLDYASALLNYGQCTGNPSFLAEALALLKGVIANSLYTIKEKSVAYSAAWRKLALTMKARYQLTHDPAHFDEADVTFRETILAIPKNSELWLDWGDLFLHAGWHMRNFKLIEIGLEKLTASKVKEADPVRVSLLLGKGLIYFGLFLENLKLLKDGQQRIEAAATIGPGQPQSLHASAFAELALGLYFSDEERFARAAALFEQQVCEHMDSLEAWHALFQTYMAWGLKIRDAALVKKGIRAIARICELRPFSYIYLNEWGVALLRLRQLVSDSDEAQGCVEEAIIKLRRAHELCEDEETLYNWGCALDFLGDLTADEEYYTKAIELLTSALEKRPSELHVRYHLGLAFSHLGELTRNVEYLKQAVALIEFVANIDREDDNIWCELGYALLNLSELGADAYNVEVGIHLRQEAERALMRAAALGCDNAYYHLACLYSLAGHFDASIHYLEKAESANLLPSRGDMEHDEWLANVRTTQAFKDFLMRWESDG